MEIDYETLPLIAGADGFCAIYPMSTPSRYSIDYSLPLGILPRVRIGSSMATYPREQKFKALMKHWGFLNN